MGAGAECREVRRSNEEFGGDHQLMMPKDGNAWKMGHGTDTFSDFSVTIGLCRERKLVSIHLLVFFTELCTSRDWGCGASSVRPIKQSADKIC